MIFAYTSARHNEQIRLIDTHHLVHLLFFVKAASCVVISCELAYCELFLHL